MCVIFFFKQKTAYEVRISDWSSDVCSSDLGKGGIDAAVRAGYDSIEHGMWADEESLRLMKQHGTYLIPTVWPITWVGDTPEKVLRGPMKDINPASLSKLLKLGDQPKRLVRMAIEIGPTLALGPASGI